MASKNESGSKMKWGPHNMWVWVQNNLGYYEFNDIRFTSLVRYYCIIFFYKRLWCMHSLVQHIVDENLSTNEKKFEVWWMIGSGKQCGRDWLGHGVALW